MFGSWHVKKLWYSPYVGVLTFLFRYSPSSIWFCDAFLTIFHNNNKIPTWYITKKYVKKKREKVIFVLFIRHLSLLFDDASCGVFRHIDAVSLY